MIKVFASVQDCLVLLNNKSLGPLLGERTAKAFEKQFGIKTVGQLLEHYPRRYISRGELTKIGSVPLGELVTIVAEVVSVSARPTRGRSKNLLEVVVSDGEKEVTLAFFNQPWRQNQLKPKSRGLFSGKIGVFNNRYQLTHPDYELFEEIAEDQAKAWSELPIPVYSASGALASWKIQKSIELVLDAEPEIPELLPSSVLAENTIIPLSQAIQNIHRPKKHSDWQMALESLRFHEAMILQTQLKAARDQRLKNSATERRSGNLLAQFDKSLPFELTQGQFNVGQEIESDLGETRPMHRLLQGEVGSGKTLVALRAMLTVAESGGQTAMLVPTEVLATQHYLSIRNSLGELADQVKIRLLTGSMPANEKKQALLEIASGKALIVVGTHALLSEQVSFFDLALLVVDEQHRFGVGQREQLKTKAKNYPHTLVMTATPIPRTMAITVFGDLEISTLTELPAGRQPIDTHVVSATNPALVSRVWQRVSEEINQGRQAFVICPRISKQLTEPSETEELEIEDGLEPAAAEEIYQALRKNASLAGISIGLLHGRLDSEEKARVMAAFEANEISVLVSTTVIEVGVNVPNATAMVVLDAERFGISQLHQLRGRVGRGQHKGLCLLVTDSQEQTLTWERLQAVAATTDGFKLSEIDLELRGEGDVLGDSQSGGKSGLKLLRVIKDADLIVKAQHLVDELPAEAVLPAMTALIEIGDASALSRS